MMNDRGFDGYRGDLNRQCVTIPEALKSAGYRSYMSGKWHVTKVIHPETEADKHNWPLQRGFDRFYGTIHGAGSFFDPNTLTRDNEYVSPMADPEYTPEQMANGEFYYTDAIADHAVRFITEHHYESDDQPFFLVRQLSPPHTGRCTLWKKTLPSTKASTMPAMRRFAMRATRRMVELGVIEESQHRELADPR